MSGDNFAPLLALPYVRMLGFELRQEDEGLRGHLPFAEHLIGNPLVPALHGGVVGALLHLTASARLMAEAGAGAGKVPQVFSCTIEYLPRRNCAIAPRAPKSCRAPGASPICAPRHGSRIQARPSGRRRCSFCWGKNPGKGYFRALLTCRARAKARMPSGTFSVITEPAATNAPAPMLTGATRALLEPINTSAPIFVRCLALPS